MGETKHISWIIVICSTLLQASMLNCQSDCSSKVDRLYIDDSVVPVKGQSLQLHCIVNYFKDSSNIDITRSDLQANDRIATCIPSLCAPLAYPTKQRYAVSSNSTGMFLQINSLNRTEDGNIWICRNPCAENKTLHFTIYTVPKDLLIDSPSTQDQDLVMNAVTLKCSTGCAYPQPSIKWFFTDFLGSRQEWTTSGIVTQNTSGCTDSEINYTSTLNIPRYTSFTDNGDKSVKFSCGITSFPGLTQPLYSGLSVIVRFAVYATTPTITNRTTENRVVLENDNVTLECMSSITRPAVLVSWKKGLDTLTSVKNTVTKHDRDLVSVTSVVTFTPNRNDNNKTIFCETAIPGQEPKPTTQQGITVYWPPTTPYIPTTNVPFLEGQTGKSIYCQATEYGNPTSSSEWSSEYGTPDNTDSRKLKLPTLSSEQNGISVSCQLKNQFTEQKSLMFQSQAIEIAVEYAPIVNIQQSNTVINSIARNEGQGISVLCSAHGNPVPTVTWIGHTLYSAYLSIDDLDRRDHGTYTCKASAKSTHYPQHRFVTEKTLDIVVSYAPVMTVELSNKDPEENSNLLISCRATGRPANYTYTSLFQTWGSVNIPNPHLPVNGVIDIQSVQLEDSGTYTCLGNNGITDRNNVLDQTGNVTISIKVSPKFLLDDTVFVGAIGKTAYITVPFYSYPDIRHVEFRFPNGTQILNSNKYVVTYEKSKVSDKFYGQTVELKGYVAVLQIKDEVEADFVNYTLILDNDMGSPKERTLEHIPVNKPKPPENVTFEDRSLTETSVVIKWNPGFDGNLKQTFVLRFKRQGEPNWLEVAKEDEGTDIMKITLTGLADGTSFLFQMYSKNSEGRSSFTETSIFTTIKKEYACEKDNYALIVGVAFGVVIVFVVIYGIYVTVLLRRKNVCNTMQKEGTNEQSRSQMYVNLELPKKSTALKTNQRENTTFTDNSEDQYTELDKELREKESAYDAISSM